MRHSGISVAELKSLPTAVNSKLVIDILSSKSDTEAAAMVSSLSKQGIVHIDSVIANAGTGETFESTLLTPMDELRYYFEANTLGPIKLFQVRL